MMYSQVGINSSQPQDNKSDVNAMIGASRGALVFAKGNLRSNHRFISDDITSQSGIGSRVGVAEDTKEGMQSPNSKMPPLSYKR